MSDQPPEADRVLTIVAGRRLGVRRAVRAFVEPVADA